jgi:5-methyltetrahydrofolate--homocysteine methyltransferase
VSLWAFSFIWWLCALADRFAEALPNILSNIRKNIWGYTPDENLSTEAMIDEVYKGIRPTRLSACPDHLENLLFGNY